MKRILILILLSLLIISINAEESQSLQFLKPGNKYTISVIHNSKNGKDYTPSSNGIGGEDVWIMVDIDGKGITLHQTISNLIFSEGKGLSQHDNIAECNYIIKEDGILTGTSGGDYAEQCSVLTKTNGKDGTILVTKMAEANDGTPLYGFHIWDGIFDDILWCFTSSDISNEIRNDKELINGLEIRWKNGLSNTQKGVIRQIVKNMVLIESGSFMMGSSNASAEDNENPVHQVNLSEYYINKYPITEKEVKVILDIEIENPKGSNYPMVNINRNDCWTICEKLEDYTGLKFAIPTEAQWEYAARGGEYCDFSGSSDINLVGWYEDNSYEKLHPVGQKRPNKFGLYDMSGNVFEWCSDYYYKKYSSDTQTDPLVRVRDDSGFAPYCIMRGGSFKYSKDRCRVTRRDWAKAYNSYDDVGFRLVIFDAEKLNLIN